MRYSFCMAAFAAVSYAVVVRRDQCCFQIQATGGVSGVMGQLDDGQNRLNGAYSPATYCYSNGGITDANGRGCIVTTTNDATHQFQCDQGTAAQAGFSISDSGILSFDSDEQFYACPYNNGDIIEYNLYTQELAGQDKCVPVHLSTDGKCTASGSTCSMASETSSATASASTAPAYTSMQDGQGYRSVSSVAVVPSSSPDVLTSLAIPTTSIEGSSSTVSLPGYESSSAVIVEVSSTIEFLTSSIQSPTQTTSNSVPEVPAYSSESKVTAPAYTASVETSVIASTYSASPRTSSQTLASTWTTIASSTTSTNLATPSSTTTSLASSEASTTVTAPSNSVSICQTSLTGAYQTPHLIVPISSNSPDTAYGTQYDAYVDSENSTIFNFDIPSSYEGMTCTTIFLFPEIADLETSSYTFSGSGDLVFSELSTAATEDTTYNTAPSVASVLNTVAIQPGNSYVVASGSCAAGTTVSIELSSQSGLSLDDMFEDWNPSSLGLYITAC